MSKQFASNSEANELHGAVIMETVQWSSLTDVDDVEPITDQDYAVLREVKEILHKHGMMDRLGVCLLHRHFDVKEDELAVEYTDVEKRISTVKVESAGRAKGPFLETMWRFSDRPDEVTACVRRCSDSDGHKNVHVKDETE
ncbi:MAG: hypothetical protein QOH06_1612 [Acidobacteriota bacterium]|jgi:hypothetical protein|nr:hypothetical protein [Acidobacteriota bacterium]